MGLPLGGTNVAANTQIGRENTQTIGQDSRFTPSVNSRGGIDNVEQSQNKVRTDSVENVQINNIPPWVILLLILGWLLPSPGEMARTIGTLLVRRKKE
jgi:hypothetical protein